MKRLILAVACGIAVLHTTVATGQNSKPVAQNNHGGKIETRYDGFAYETILRLKKMKITCEAGYKDSFKNGCVSIDVALHLPGSQLNFVRNVTLQIIFETKSWDQSHLPDQRDLSIVADAETLRLGRMRLVENGDTLMRETRLETLEATVSYEVFKKIVQSQSVELQVGPSMMELREKNKAALRDLDSRVIGSPAK